MKTPLLEIALNLACALSVVGFVITAVAVGAQLAGAASVKFF